MRARLVAVLGIGLTGALATPLGAQLVVESKARFDLVADRTGYPPGATARVAARVTVDEGWHVNSHTPSYDFLIPTELSLEVPGGSVGEVRYPEHRLQQFAFTDEPIAVYDGAWNVLAEVTLPASGTSVGLTGKLRYQACDDKQCLPPVVAEATLELPLTGAGAASHPDVFGAVAPPDPAPPPAAPPPAAAAPSSGARSSEGSAARPGLVLTLLLAVVGGLILNAMPCVLPVLSLKLFSLVKSAGDGRRATVRGSLATVAGILASFWLLAALVVVARGAGSAVGWGVQFQQPGFVAFLAVVMVLFALNMWGLFEILLPARIATVAGGSQGSSGLLGHFATGLFATLMATPCSAPFLGAAVGFALAQPAATVFAVFTAVGVGLALPYLALAVFPGSARWLPRPGEWMVTLKGTMGFLLAGAAVWLVYVLAAQISSDAVAYFELTLLLVALGVWLRGRAASPAARGFAVALALVAAAGGVALAARAPAATSSASAGYLHDWKTFDEREAERLAAGGRLVFVDVTADWCLTCKATERLVLETEETARLFADHGVVAMRADWTRRDDAITAFLARFGRSAVPFYVLYRPGSPPHAFGELLTARRLTEAVEASSTARARLD